MNGCAECLKKPREIDRSAHRGTPAPEATAPRPGTAAREGFFGAATPSATRPVKAHTSPPQAPKQQGARPGQPGAGRQAFAASQAERMVDLGPLVGDRGPDCQALWEDKGTGSRAVIESHPVKAERGLYRLPTRYGPRCRRTFQPRAPAGLPQRLYGNPRMATATTRHSLHVLPLGRVCAQTGLGPGSVVEVFHRLARVCAGMPDWLIRESRQAPVTHADESGGRTTGHKGYAWLFAPRGAASSCSVRPGRRASPSRSSARVGCQATGWSSATAATRRSPVPSHRARAMDDARARTWKRTSLRRPR